MQGGVVVRLARRRAGISQREMADRLGTHQSVIARWEAGVTSPSFENVVSACRSAGYELQWTVVPRDDDLERVLSEQLARTPTERVASVVNLAALRQRRA